MKTSSDLDLTNSRVLVRMDFNVPLDDDGTVLDDSRIRAALPSLRYLLGKNATCVLMSHLGRPGDKLVAQLSLAPVAEKLAQRLPDNRIRHCDEVVGSRAEERAQSLEGDEILLPTDHVMGMQDEVRTGREINGDWMGVDIGPDTASRYTQAIGTAATVVWNGPMGKFEEERYFNGTRQIAEAMAASRAVTIVGGGETGQAIHRLAIAEQLTHLSTGGGAFLAYLAHSSLSALNALKEA